MTTGAQPDLFGPTEAWTGPPGLVYRADFLSADEEAGLLDFIAGQPLAEARYKADTARRRVVSYGHSVDYDANLLTPGPPMPPLLQGLRQRVADWAGETAEAFAQALVAEYRPGTPLGWHRDVPDFDLVVGVSLLSAARMRFRRYPPVNPKARDLLDLQLAPRSGYVLRGPARWDWQHSIAPTAALRYSITFRTLRAVGGRDAPAA